MVGREYEKRLFLAKLNSQKSEFIAVYGRRRVGKTYLIRSVLQHHFVFQLTGLAKASLKEQLVNFELAKKEQHPIVSLEPPTSWLEAFTQLKQFVLTSNQPKKVIFIDELPWLDTPRSGFLTALEHFWNSWASARKDVVLVVCGSAASWMIHQLINNKGGLHNRITLKIKLNPFTLKECKEMMLANKIRLDNYQLLQLYMCLGGIPFYWEAIEKGQSATQTIQQLCFDQNGLLRNEYANLFKSLFDKSEKHEKIVDALAQKAQGLSRDEIQQATGISNGGGFTRVLDELEESGFIRKYAPFQRKSRESHYQLSDFFTLFHLRFMSGNTADNENYWLTKIDHPAYRTWSGYAFEQVCLAHTDLLKKALGISGVDTTVSAWRSKQRENGAQIDLVIDRRDHVITICEMKFSINPFTIDKAYDANLRNKIGLFKSETGTSKAVFLTMITTYGLVENEYAGNVTNSIDMQSLFV